jgi:hypothetical protein
VCILDQAGLAGSGHAEPDDHLTTALSAPPSSLRAWPGLFTLATRLRVEEPEDLPAGIRDLELLVVEKAASRELKSCRWH